MSSHFKRYFPSFLIIVFIIGLNLLGFFGESPSKNSVSVIQHNTNQVCFYNENQRPIFNRSLNKDRLLSPFQMEILPNGNYATFEYLKDYLGGRFEILIVFLLLMRLLYVVLSMLPRLFSYLTKKTNNAFIQKLDQLKNKRSYRYRYSFFLLFFIFLFIFNGAKYLYTSHKAVTYLKEIPTQSVPLHSPYFSFILKHLKNKPGIYEDAQSLECP